MEDKDEDAKADAKSLVCGAIGLTIIGWAFTVPIMLFASYHMGVFICMFIIFILCMCPSHMMGASMMMEGYYPTQSRLVMGTTALLTLGGFLTYVIGQGSLYFYCMSQNVAEGCSVRDLKALSDSGTMTLFCRDGFVPPESEATKYSTATKEQKGSKGQTYELFAKVAPIYMNGESFDEPVALAAMYGWSGGAFKGGASDLQVPSPGPPCGSRDAGGLCGFTANFIGAQDAWATHGTDEVVEVIQMAARDAKGWGFEGADKLPIVVMQSPTEFDGADTLFLLSFVLMAVGSPLLLPFLFRLVKAPPTQIHQIEDYDPQTVLNSESTPSQIIPCVNQFAVNKSLLSDANIAFIETGSSNQWIAALCALHRKENGPTAALDADRMQQLRDAGWTENEIQMLGRFKGKAHPSQNHTQISPVSSDKAADDGPSSTEPNIEGA